MDDIIKQKTVTWQTVFWCNEHVNKGISTEGINWDFPRFLKIAQNDQFEGELQYDVTYLWSCTIMQHSELATLLTVVCYDIASLMSIRVTLILEILDYQKAYQTT